MKTKIKENIHPAEYKGLMTYPLKSFAAVQKVSWNFPFNPKKPAKSKYPPVVQGYRTEPMV